ncbi:MAG: hypothetical protein BBJ57_02150 [Desulfobacterales bacterium PC51MH44]|nr:MAG: hypothetical protein BBJ57_02150 [Desulfobacterales bacterium PC51MH44]
MPSKINQWREAGFTQDEITAHIAQKKTEWLGAGFSQDEIHSYLGTSEYDPKAMNESMQTYLSQDEPDSFWDKFLKSFEPPWAERRARSYKALVGAGKAKLSPSRFEPTMKEAFSQGYEQSVTGLIARGKAPDNRIPAAAMKYLPTSQRIAMQTATVAGDLPFMTAGAVIGGFSGGPAAPLTAMGGAFALPAGLRKVYMDYYEKGEIQTFAEFWQRMGDATMETLKGEAVGIATAATGARVPGMLSYPAEVAAMTTMGAAMEGTVPEPQDFLDAAIIIGGMKFSGVVASRLRTNYAETGEHPYGVIERMKSDPSLQEKLVSSNYEKPGLAKASKEPVVSESLKSDYDKVISRVPSEIKEEITVSSIKEVKFPEAYEGEGGRVLKNKDGTYRILIEKGEKDIQRLLEHELAHIYVEKHPELQKPRDSRDMFYLERATDELAKTFREKKLVDKTPQTAEERVLETISVGKGKERRTIAETLHDAYTAAVDDMHPLNRVVSQMAKGEKVEVAKDPYKLARLFRGVKGIADHFLEYSPITFKKKANIGKPLSTILNPVKNDLNGIRAYLKSKRALELDKRGIETGVPIDAAKEVVKNGKEKYGKIFDELQEYQTHTLTYLRDSGLISRQTFKDIKELNKDYAPFYRVIEGKKGKGAGKGLEAFDPIKAIKGSELKTIDPLESIIKNTYLFTNLAEKNRIGASLVKFAAARQGLGKYVKKIKKPIKPIKITAKEAGTLEDFTIFRPAAFSPKENQIRVWFNGKDQLFEVHPDIARVFKSLDAESMSFVTKIMSVPAKWLRAGAILSPEFIARNPIRDQLSAFVFGKWGFTPGVDLIKGIASTLKKDEFYRDWQKSGGMLSELTALDRKYLQKGLGEVVSKYPVLNRIKYGANPIEMLRVLSELSEQGTRVGAFRKARKKGATLEEAGFEAREITLDFARIGAKTRAVNSMVAFWNANVQGTDKLVRSFKDNPIATTAKVTAGITLPSVLLAVVNHDDGRWDDIPRWQKDLFWIVMPGHVSKEKWAKMSSAEQAEFMEDNHIWRIPKPFELGIIFGTVPERFTEALLDKNPEALTGIWNAIGRGAAPGVLPTISIPIIENWANRSLFLDRPLIPANKEGLLPEYQYKAYTSEAAKAIGKLLGKLPPLEENPNIAPVKIENMVRGWTGGLGMHIVKLASLGLEKAGVLPAQQRPTETLSDIPVVKAFHVRYPAAGSENVNKFYEEYFRSKKRWQTFKHLIEKEFNPQEAVSIIVGHEAALVRMDGIYKAISRAHQALNLIHNHPDMNADEKRQLIDVIYLHMSKMATAGNKALKQIKKSLKEK